EILDEARIAAPLVPGIEVHRREAADRRAPCTGMVRSRRQQDLAAEIRLAYREPELALMRRQAPISGIDEQQVRLAGLQARLEDLLPQEPRRDSLDRLAGHGASQRERTIVAHGLHELVGDRNAVMQV